MLAHVAIANSWVSTFRGEATAQGIAHPQVKLIIGWPVGIIRSVALIICALGAVMASIFLASQTGVGSNAVGASYALPCFAAVFLGGVVMTGGRGSFIGALLVPSSCPYSIT